MFEAEPLPNRSHEDVDNAIVKVLEAVAKNGVAASDLERARLWWRNRLLGESRTAAGRAAQLVRTHTEYGTYKVEELLAKLEAVTTEDCQRVVKEYFSGKSYFSIVQLTAVNEGGQ